MGKKADPVLIARAYAAGTTLAKIGEMAGVTRQRVEQIARELGLPRRRRSRIRGRNH